MNKKVFWFIGFLIVAAVSCWATASSFHLMMPGMPLIAVWAMTIVFFVLASYAVKMIFDALNNDGTLNHPKAMLWGGLALLIFTWVIISLPTNAHTFFYRLQIGNVATDDLKATKVYSLMLRDKVIIDIEDSILNDKVMREWSQYEDEVITGKGQHGSGIGEYANRHITAINEMVGAEYALPTPQPTNGASQQFLASHLNWFKENHLKPMLQRVRHDKFQVSDEAAKEAARDVANIEAMQDSIHAYTMIGSISSAEAEPLIKQTEGVLTVAYTNIKSNNQYVKFNPEEDKEQYTADPIETKTTRFLNPYSVAHDYFSGKIPFTFTFWLLLSILIDVAGFFFFDMTFKKEYNF